jgi:glycosyltransferase involved in cell wall biosynthesis
MDIIIDASRNRSGGAISHILGILNDGVNPNFYGINKIYVCSYSKLLKRIEDKPWLHKINHCFLEKSIIHQVLWQIFILPRMVKRKKIKVCLYTDAAAFVRVKNSIVMSRDMLSFEPGHMELFPRVKDRLRLRIIGWLQIRSMQKARNVVFLTKYAQAVISKHTGPLHSTTIIPHGLTNNFIDVWKKKEKLSNTITIIYISNASYYKHHINVLRAVKKIKEMGIDVRLNLIGANVGAASANLQRAIKAEDAKDYVRTTKFMNINELVDEIKKADIGIFASSCENMPNTLVEMMGSGIPIVCSNRGPMLEVLGSSNFTFNPFKTDEIFNVLVDMINNYDNALNHGQFCLLTSKKFTWQKCSRDTFKNISNFKFESDTH